MYSDRKAIQTVLAINGTGYLVKPLNMKILHSNTIFGDIDEKWRRITKRWCVLQLVLGCWFGTQVRLTGRCC